ncbi:hypothetical protein SCLCIDRAFT_83566, partial [Scleroderma citrinum Foug A]
KHRALDILTIFSNRCIMRFSNKETGVVNTLSGHWCNECVQDEELLARYGRRKAFYTGSNSSCRQHIRSHYELYKVRCAEKGLSEHHHALPRTLLKAKQ